MSRVVAYIGGIKLWITHSYFVSFSNLNYEKIKHLSITSIFDTIFNILMRYLHRFRKPSLNWLEFNISWRLFPIQKCPDYICQGIKYTHGAFREQLFYRPEDASRMNVAIPILDSIPSRWLLTKILNKWLCRFSNLQICLL